MIQKQLMNFTFKIKLTCVALILLFTNVQAQISTAHRKSSNAYKESYQRLFSGSAGSSFFEIKENGTLYACGQNINGKLGDNSVDDKNVLVPIGNATNWKSIAVGAKFTAGLRADGTLWTWGSNAFGQLGDGTQTQKIVPTQVGTGTNWIKIAVGQDFMLAIKADGTLWAWGKNNVGQLGDGTATSKLVPTQIGVDTNWTSVSCGWEFSTALKSNGTLWTWGRNNLGQLGDGTTTQSNVPKQVGVANNWVKLSSGDNHTLAIKANGTLWAWGYNVTGQLGNGNTVTQTSPIQIGTSTWASASASNGFSNAIKADGTLWAWGTNSVGQLGLNDVETAFYSTPAQVGTDNKWTNVTQAATSVYASKCNGTAFAWGENFIGQLGNGTLTNAPEPIQISTVNTGILSVSTGENHTVVVKLDGSLWTSGDNQYGQLGLGTLTYKTVGVKVGADHNWVSAIAGRYYTIALKNDGTLWAWGSNFYGQIGNGTTVDKNLPVQVGTDNNWASISVGFSHTLALKTDGTLWGWGSNENGRLGDNIIAKKLVPTQIGTDNNWVSATAGGSYSLGLKSDGTIWSCGYNFDGQLGLSDRQDRLFLTQIGSDNTWVCLGAGSNHSMALKANGTLYTWGKNNTMQLGDNTIVSFRTFPTLIGTDKDWTAISATNVGSNALKANGTLWAWGGNGIGQYGNNTVTDSNVPLQITTQTNVLALYIGGASQNMHTAIIKSDRNMVCFTGNNTNGQTARGLGLTGWSMVFNCTNYTSACISATLPTVTQTDNGNGSYTLTVATGLLNNNQNWYWSSGVCGGTAAGIGTSITVTVGDTYFVRGENGCADEGPCSVGEVVNVVLPVTLLSYDVKKNNNQALLQWKTANEVNNNRFELLKSTDGINFSPLATVKPQTKAPFNYLYTDANVNAGVNYYRLLQVDNNGRTTNLGTRVLNFSLSNQTVAKVYPNPASTVLNIDFGSNTYTSINLVNLLGKVVLSVAVNPSQNKMIINTSKLAKGLYILQLKKQNGIETRSIIIQ